MRVAKRPPSSNLRKMKFFGVRQSHGNSCYADVSEDGDGVLSGCLESYQPSGVVFEEEQQQQEEGSDLDSTISKEDDYSDNDGTQRSLSKARGEDWKPLNIEGKHFPESASLLEAGNLGGYNNRKQMDTIRRHLVALGWRIELKMDGKNRRLRYFSPQGKTFYSLLKVFCDLAGTTCSVSRLPSEKPPIGAGIAHELIELEEAPRRKQVEPEATEQNAITDYMNIIESKFSYGDVNQLRSNVKKMLVSMGWRLWLKDKKVKQELRYTTPEGKTYMSLYTACKGYMEAQGSYPHSKPNRKRSTSELLSNQQSKRRKVAIVPVAVGHEPENSCPPQQSKRKKANTIPVTVGHGPESSVRRRSSKASRHIAALSPGHNTPKTVLNWLIDHDVVLPREKVFYCHGEGMPSVKEGRVTRHGIKCECCKRVLSLADFKAHSAGRGSGSGRPASNIFLQDGRSLLQCQLQMVHSYGQQGVHHQVKKKADLSECYTDDICSVCNDGGSLMICNHCPTSFHPKCIGLEDVPPGDWFCHQCSCTVCGSSEFQHEYFTEKTFVYCDQCEQGYHVGCLGERDSKLSSCSTRDWFFCSRKCKTIFHSLRDLVGKRNPTSVKGLSWTLLRSSSGDAVEDEIMAEHHSKLLLALDVLHECFVTIIEPRTRSDFLADLLFNRESELSRLNFRGFYTILLEKGDELVSVATFRVFGERIAEMPLIGTRFQYRRQGMCRLLVRELERLLSAAGVERLVLPAVHQLLETWTGSFGFHKMTSSDRLALSQYSIQSFQETTMCQKMIN